MSSRSVNSIMLWGSYHPVTANWFGVINDCLVLKVKKKYEWIFFII